ncbi:MAG: choice-of-anchor D domain-containing protein [Roseibacillus sp.]
MKRSFLFLLGLVIATFTLATPAIAIAILEVDGTPHPTNNNTFAQLSNDEASNYAKGTDFLSTPVSGGVVTHRLRLRSTGTSNVTYTVSESSPHFRAISVGSVLVAVTGERIFDIEFNPTSVGLKTTVLTINSNSIVNPSFEINLRGVGTAPEADILGGSSLNFGISDGDTTPNFTDRTNFGSRDIFDGGDSRFFRLYNSGTSDLQFINGSVTPDQGFTISSLPANASFLGSGAGHNFILTFDPSTIGTKNATVTIQTDDSNEGIYTFAVTGTGTVTPDIEVKGSSTTVSALTNITRFSNSPHPIHGTDFENHEVNSSTSNIVRLRNVGTATLNVTPSILSGASSDQFRLSSTATSNIGLGFSGFKDVFIFFEPTEPGEHFATIRIDSNDPDEDPYDFLIRGFATAPEATVLGDTDFSEEIVNGDDTPRVGDGTNFLDVDVDGPSEKRTFRIKNDGTSDLIFLDADITSEPGFSISHPASNTTIPAPGYIEFDVFFNPSTDGQVTATVTIITTDANETPYTFDVTANGVGDPNAQVRGNYVGSNNLGDIIPAGTYTTSYDLGTQFGEVELGESETEIFVLENIGDGTLDYNITVSGAGFTVFDDTITLEPNQGSNSRDVFGIVFEPTTRGVKSALVTVSSNDPDTPSYIFAVEGTAVGPELDVFGGQSVQNMSIKDGRTSTNTSDGTDFGTLNVGAPGTTHTFLLRNDGEENLIIANQNSALSDDTHFTVTGLPNPTQPILPQTNWPIQITFEPQSAGTKTVEVTLISNDFDENPYTFNITGIGLDGPEINLLGGAGGVVIPDGHDTPSVTDGTDLGTAEVGQSVSTTFTIENNGNQSLNISNPAPGGDFSAVLGNTSVAAGSTTTLTVTFTPLATGPQVVFVTIPNNDSDENPYSFAVRAEGFLNQPPSFDSFTTSGDTGTLKFQTIAGVSYQLRQSTDLESWANSGTPIAGTGSLTTLTVSNITNPGQPHLFYRLEIVSP